MQINNIEQLWVVIAEYYRIEISKPVVIMYGSDMKDLKLEDVNDAFIKYRTNPNNKRMPFPADLRAIISPEFDIDNVAKTLPAKIMYLIQSKGRHWGQSFTAPRFFDDGIKAEVGEIGLSLIMNHGGWIPLVDEANESKSKEIFKAQMREEIKAISILSINGNLDEKIKLPNSGNNNNLQKLDFKGITNG